MQAFIVRMDDLLKAEGLKSEQQALPSAFTEKTGIGAEPKTRKCCTCGRILLKTDMTYTTRNLDDVMCLGCGLQMQTRVGGKGVKI